MGLNTLGDEDPSCGSNHAELDIAEKSRRSLDTEVKQVLSTPLARLGCSNHNYRTGEIVTLVVGFIDTPEGWAAVRYAATEAKTREARLVVVNSMRGGRHDDQEDYREVQEAVDSLNRLLSESGVDSEVVEYVRGNSPSRDLIEASKEFDADLIVIGIRRRTATGKALLGSNALDILHDADLPVVCVKADQTEL